MPNRRRFLLLSAASLVAVSCSEKPAAGGASELRIGMDLTYPPFEMQDKAGHPDGVGVRMAEALAAKLGRNIDRSCPR
jgi:hypothetical protein